MKEAELMRNDTPESPRLKRCPKCGIEKPATLEYFYHNKQKKSGLACYCKECSRPRKHEWFEANKERAREYDREYREKNRERILARRRAYHAAHREKENARRRKNNERNREQKREYNRQWQRNNRDLNLAGSQRYRARKRGAQGTHTAEDLRLIYESQKGLCWWCEKPVGDSYQVDHRIPLSRGGSDNPENLVIACPACNQSKRDKMPGEWIGRLL